MDQVLLDKAMKIKESHHARVQGVSSVCDKCTLINAIDALLESGDRQATLASNRYLTLDTENCKLRTEISDLKRHIQEHGDYEREKTEYLMGQLTAWQNLNNKPAPICYDATLKADLTAARQTIGQRDRRITELHTENGKLKLKLEDIRVITQRPISE